MATTHTDAGSELTWPRYAVLPVGGQGHARDDPVACWQGCTARPSGLGCKRERQPRQTATRQEHTVCRSGPPQVAWLLLASAVVALTAASQVVEWLAALVRWIAGV